MLWSGEQASEPGLRDGDAGGGQGQTVTEISPKTQPPPAQSTHFILEGQWWGCSKQVKVCPDGH